MAAVCNGLFAYGGFIPFCATFLTFIGYDGSASNRPGVTPTLTGPRARMSRGHRGSSYAQGAYRLSALSHMGVLYIMTHDSIGLGASAVLTPSGCVHGTAHLSAESCG